MYSLRSEFDIDKHKMEFKNYLEVVILEDGTVQYAVPSHQEKMIQLACEKHGITRAELNEQTPAEYYGDFLRWLCKLTRAISVWDRWVFFDTINQRQVGTLKQLKQHRLYKGAIPKV